MEEPLCIGEHRRRPDDAHVDAGERRPGLIQSAVWAVEGEADLGIDMLVPPAEEEPSVVRLVPGAYSSRSSFGGSTCSPSCKSGASSGSASRENWRSRATSRARSSMLSIASAQVSSPWSRSLKSPG